MNEVVFQTATQATRAIWREPTGAEREKVWDLMVDPYPHYAAHRAGCCLGRRPKSKC